MKLLLSCSAALLFLTLSTHAKAAIVASHDFDAPLNLTGSTSTPVAFNGFTNAGDGWGIYSFAGGGPFALFDDSVNGSGGNDAFEPDALGIVQSTKTDNFFGIVDTQNGDNDGPMTGTFSFDISSATGGLTRIDIDFAAMGDFESSDVLSIGYSIDGGTTTNIFSSSVAEDIAAVPYTMESGTLVEIDDPLLINGVQLSNSFQTISAGISGTGNSLLLEVVATTNGGTEAMGFDNIVINGVTAIPEPGMATLLGFGFASLVTLRRGNRGRKRDR